MYRIIPHTGSIANRYYKVQKKYLFGWYTVTKWLSSIEDAEKWVNETMHPKYVNETYNEKDI